MVIMRILRMLLSILSGFGLIAGSLYAWSVYNVDGIIAFLFGMAGLVVLFSSFPNLPVECEKN